jgi:tetratricopeptide (TPR) repeat protein
MGRERTPAGKFVYFCAAGLIFFSLWSCSTTKKEFTWSSRQEVSPRKAQTQGSPASEEILRAKRLFDLGDYAGSLEETQKILSRPSKNDSRDQALFNMGVIYAHVENPQRDLGKALYSFKAMLQEYPQSPLAGEAKVLVGVLQENEELSQGIQKFKQKNEELSQGIQKFKQENEKLSQGIEKLKQENEKLSQGIEKLKQENEKLSQVIEKFKQVDIDVEEKKREKAR